MLSVTYKMSYLQFVHNFILPRPGLRCDERLHALERHLGLLDGELGAHGVRRGLFGARGELDDARGGLGEARTDFRRRGRGERGLQHRERLTGNHLVTDDGQRFARRGEQATGLRRADLRERAGPGRDGRRHAHALDEPARRDRLNLRENFPLLLLEEAYALGRLRQLRVLRGVRVGEDFDRAQLDGGVRPVRRHEESDLPLARLGERERGQVNPRLRRRGLRMLDRGVALPQDELHQSLAARLQREQVGDVGDEGRRLAGGGRLVLGEDLVAVGPDGDLRRLFLMRVVGVRVVVGIGLAAAGQHGQRHYGGQPEGGPRESGLHSFAKSKFALSGNVRQMAVSGHTTPAGAPGLARNKGGNQASGGARGPEGGEKSAGGGTVSARIGIGRVARTGGVSKVNCHATSVGAKWSACRLERNLDSWSDA